MMARLVGSKVPSSVSLFKTGIVMEVSSGVVMESLRLVGGKLGLSVRRRTLSMLTDASRCPNPSRSK